MILTIKADYEIITLALEKGLEEILKASLRGFSVIYYPRFLPDVVKGQVRPHSEFVIIAIARHRVLGHLEALEFDLVEVPPVDVEDPVVRHRQPAQLPHFAEVFGDDFDLVVVQMQPVKGA